MTKIEDKEKTDKDSEFRAKNLVIFGINEHQKREEWVEKVSVSLVSAILI